MFLVGYLLSNAEDELALTNVGAEGNLVVSSSTDLGSHLYVIVRFELV